MIRFVVVRLLSQIFSFVEFIGCIRNPMKPLHALTVAGHARTIIGVIVAFVNATGLIDADMQLFGLNIFNSFFGTIYSPKSILKY
jgi:hypothetical protein